MLMGISLEECGFAFPFWFLLLDLQVANKLWYYQFIKPDTVFMIYYSASTVSEIFSNLSLF